MATTITANGINFPDGSASAPSIGGTDTNTGLFTGSDIVGFATGGVERIRIDANGKICINNDNALSDLHICTAGSSEQNGTLRLGGQSASLGLVLDYDQSSATVSRITANPTYNNTSALLKICVDGDNNPNQLVLRGDGKVGIGTTSPDRKLEVQNDGSYAAKFGGASGGSDFAIEIGQTGNSGSPGFNAVTGSMVFQIAGSEKARFNGSTGNFGINNNSPDRKLEVQNDSDYAAKFSGGSGAGHTSIEIGQTALNGSAGFNATGGSMLFDIAGAEKMRLSSDGKLGIGTTSPDKSLTIGGSTPVIKLNDGSSRLVEIRGGSTSYDPSILSMYAANLYLGAGATLTSSFHSDGQIKVKRGNNNTIDINAVKGTYWGYSTGSYAGVLVGNSGVATNSTIFMGVDVTGNTNGSFTGDGREIVFRNNINFVVPNAANNGYLNPISLNEGAATEGVPRFKQGLLFNTDSADANILNDYEYGTFNATIEGITSQSYTVQNGHYVKIGNKVHLDFYIRINSANANGSHYHVGNFPFNLKGANHVRGGGCTTYWDMSADGANNRGTNDQLVAFYGSADSNKAGLYQGKRWVGGVNGTSVNGKYLIGFFEYITDET